MGLQTVYYSALVCALTITVTSTASGASILTPHNAIVSGNFTDLNSIDIGGGLAAQGIVTFQGNSLVADGLDGELTNAFPQDATFVAAGGVTGGTAQVDAGNYYAPSGTVSCSSCTKLTTDPINFSADFGTGGTFDALSTQWSTANGGVTTSGDSIANVSGYNGGTTTITVSPSNKGMNVIYVSAADALWLSANVVNITGVSSASWLVVDVQGTADQLGGSSMTVDGGGANGNTTTTEVENVVFNYYQASSLTLNGAVLGSVLAPSAAVTGAGNGTEFDGSLVANSFTGHPLSGSGGTEFHNFPFYGGATPEPAPLACVGAGLIALALFRKRRRG